MQRALRGGTTNDNANAGTATTKAAVATALTQPKSPALRSTRRVQRTADAKPAAAAAQKTTEDREAEEAQKAQRELARKRKRQEEYMQRALHGAGPAPVMGASPSKLTIPQSPALRSTRKRVAAGQKTTEELEWEEAQKAQEELKRSRELQTRSMQRALRGAASAGTSAPVPAPKLTAPKSPALRSTKRVRVAAAPVKTTEELEWEEAQKAQDELKRSRVKQTLMRATKTYDNPAFAPRRALAPIENASRQGM